MSRPVEETLVTDRSLVGLLNLEAILLDIRHALHDEPDRKENDASDVASGSEGRLVEFGDVGRVEHGDGQRHGPYPDHLEDPESEKLEELIALVIEPIILAGLDDAEE